jgi:hypothetical protein
MGQFVTEAKKTIEDDPSLHSSALQHRSSMDFIRCQLLQDPVPQALQLHYLPQSLAVRLVAS